MTRRGPLFFIPVVSLLILAHTVAFAQITSLSNTTSTPVPGTGHNYIGLLNETVNPASGGLSARVDVPVPKGRGITLPFGFAYDSSGVHFPTQLGWDTEQNIVASGGWSYSVPFVTYADLQNVIQPFPDEWVTCAYQAGYMLRDSSGSRHVLGVSIGWGGSGCSDWTRTPGQDDFYQSSMDSGGNVNVADSHGTVYSFTGPWYGIPSQLSHTTSGGITLPSLIEDSNGNKISIQENGGVFSITDTLGSVALSTSGFGAEGNTVSVRGLSNPYTLHWGTVSSNYDAGVTTIYGGGCVNFGRVQHSYPAVTAIDLPNGKQFRFEYDATYGVLSKIYYPTGGYVAYTWGLNPAAERQWFDYHDSMGNSWSCLYQFSTPAVVSRSVSLDGTAVALEQDFSYSTGWGGPIVNWTAKQATVTAHDYVGGTSSVTDYNYQPMTVPRPPDVPTEDSIVPVEQTILYKDGSSNVVRTVTKTWQDQYLMTSEQTALENGQTSKTSFNYGAGAQITQKDDYDWGPGAPGGLLRRTVTNYASFNAIPLYPTAPSIFDRAQNVIVCNTTATCTTTSSNRVAETDYLYDETGLSPTSATSHDYTNYGSGYLNRGNATTRTQWLNTGGAAPSSHYGYDDTGQVVSFTDPMLHLTSYSYADSYTEGTAPGNTNAYVTQITYPTTNGVQHIEHFSYAYPDGQLTLSIDQNGKQTSYNYADPLRRLKEIDYPNTQTIQYGYNNDALPFTVTETRLAAPDPSIVTSTVHGGLGQLTQTRIDLDPDGTTYADSTYDGFGRLYTKGNPHRQATSTTDGTTRYGYDSLGRLVSITRPDNNIVTSAYSGTCVTVTDETQRARKSCSDALGRVTSIIEPNEASGFLSTGAYYTYYSYDALGNLTAVNQQGDGSLAARNRSFTYDSLSRLLETTNPETGRICYGSVTGTTCNRDGYDADGNRLFRTDARGIRTTYGGYDGLHRLGSKTYSDGTPAISYFYDQGPYNGLNTTNGIGRRIGMSDGTGQTAWSYDAVGNVLTRRQTIAGVTNNIVRTYNLNRALSTLTSPTGYVYTYSYSAAGRALSLADIGSGITYAQNAHYAPPGELASASHGLNLAVTESNSYNSRLQPTVLSVSSSAMPQLMSFSYDYDQGGGSNNGDVIQITNNRDITRSTAYTYDKLNRLKTAQTLYTTTWGDAYVYDPFGNLLQKNVTQGTAENLQVTVDVNNHISTSGFTYDAAGNLVWDGNNALNFDAENELNPATGYVYSYDGDGRRVEKNYQGSITYYWYDDNSNVIATTGALTRDYVYFNGKRLAYFSPISGNQHYYWSDHLGSASVMSNSDGSVIEWEADYYPFGTERVINNGLENHFLFTGYEFDYEMGYYYAGAREQSPSLARFFSPDPIGVMKQKFVDPQQWNMYSYARNNPLLFTDPTGMYLVHCGGADKKCNKAADNFERQRLQALRSKDIKVRNAAAAWGGRGEDNHINVTFKTQAQVDADAGNTDTAHYRVDARVTPNPGADHKGAIDAEFSENLKGSDLRRTIAHEGSHVEDDMTFLNSYDPTTGRYNPALNLTHFDTEFQAFEAGAGVKPYSMFPKGPKGYQQLENYINNAYHDAADPVFRPSGVFPQ
jgi:RHS repeat-associated protein